MIDENPDMGQLEANMERCAFERIFDKNFSPKIVAKKPRRGCLLYSDPILTRPKEKGSINLFFDLELEYKSE